MKNQNIHPNRLFKAIYNGTVILRAKTLKAAGIAFKSYTWKYEEPKDRLSTGKLFIEFVVDKHFAKAAIHPFTGIPSIEHTVWGFKDNTARIVFKAY